VDTAESHIRLIMYYLYQWLTTFFDQGPLLVCWMAWGATM